MRPNRTLAAVVAAIPLLVIGCDDDDITDADGTGRVRGRIASTTEPLSRAAPAGRTSGAQALEDVPTTAAAGQITFDGRFDTFATDELDADDSFTIDDVPAGEPRVVIEARNVAGEALGRSILHREVRAGGTATVAPIDGETTAEANVFIELRGRGLQPTSIATTEIAAKVDFTSDASARAVAVSSATIDALATAFEASERTFVEALERAEGERVRAEALQALGDGPATELALALDAGAGTDAAERAYLQVLAEAYARVGLGFEAQSEAGPAASAAAFKATTDTVARLAALRGNARQMAAARALLAADALGDLGASDASIQAALAAWIDLDARLSAATTAGAVLDAFDDFGAAIMAELGDVAAAAPGLDLATILQLQTTLPTAAFRTTLATAIAAATTAEAIADAYLAFFSALRQRVIATLTAAGATPAEATDAANVFVAADAALVLTS